MRISDIIESAEINNTIPLWNKAKDAALKYKDKNPEDPQSYYILGYVYFNMPQRTAQDSEQAEHAFNACLIRNPDHQLALYHLSLIYFYIDSFAEAYQTLLRTRHDYFLSIAQPWRILKLEELKLSCRLYLRDSVADEEFRSFSNLCKSLLEDPVEVPIISELAQSINAAIVGGNPISLESVRITVSLIIELDQVSAFKHKSGPFYEMVNGSTKLT